MKSHEVDYKVIGDDMQIVEIELDPGETVVAEAGAMNYMEDGITFETRMGDGSNTDAGFLGKFLSAGKRALTGESIFMTHFTNSGTGKKRVAFAAPYPGKIFPVDLSKALTPFPPVTVTSTLSYLFAGLVLIWNSVTVSIGTNC